MCVCVYIYILYICVGGCMYMHILHLEPVTERA